MTVFRFSLLRGRSMRVPGRGHGGAATRGARRPQEWGDARPQELFTMNSAILKPGGARGRITRPSNPAAHAAHGPAGEATSQTPAAEARQEGAES
ncbi:hypothetical protein AY599_06260 [Leptolyngbya valderiana BDU 20041]|nr:hypothetical protein AY599_06260 [Leptolyngbya valderiana BDU 20041]